MKITANRKDDILRRKAEYEADFSRRKSEYESQRNRYHEAQLSAMAPVQKALDSMASKYPLLQVVNRVSEGRFGSPGVSINISVNENNKFDKNVSLSWSYQAYLDRDGEVNRETSSWSGMNAVTPEQLADLEQSVAFLKELAGLDWKHFLDINMPDWDEYITTEDPSWDRDKPDFDRELIEAELEDIIGERKMIEVKPFDSSWYRGNVFVAIIKDSGSQYTIKECPKYMSETGEATKYFDRADTHRVRKSAINPVTPINIIEV